MGFTLSLSLSHTHTHTHTHTHNHPIAQCSTVHYCDRVYGGPHLLNSMIHCTCERGHANQPDDVAGTHKNLKNQPKKLRKQHKKSTRQQRRAVRARETEKESVHQSFGFRAEDSIATWQVGINARWRLH